MIITIIIKKDGRKVLCIERDMREPDRIVGELLQPGGVGHLTRLGLKNTLEGIDAATIEGYSVFTPEDKVKIPYPMDSEGKPYLGRAFHHGRFIMNLRRACIESPK